MKRLGTVLVFILVMAPFSWGAAGAAADLFAGGRTRFGISGGYGSFNDRNYAVLGLGAGYYFFDGLEAGIDGQAWLGSKPHLYELSPQVTYTFTHVPSFYPYLGGFYKRTFYDAGYADINSAGGRAGITAPLNGHAYISAGLVYEQLFKCDESLYSHCSQVYPEFGLSFTY